MSEKLEQLLWRIADTLRGKMDADDFRDYILGFIFYKYLSERMHAYADEVLKPDGITYLDIDEDNKQDKLILEYVREEAIDALGYFLKPSELFGALASRTNAEGKAHFIPEYSPTLSKVQWARPVRKSLVTCSKTSTYPAVNLAKLKMKKMS
jgi:type I restriction enzyme M protein